MIGYRYKFISCRKIYSKTTAPDIYGLHHIEEVHILKATEYFLFLGIKFRPVEVEFVRDTRDSSSRMWRTYPDMITQDIDASRLEGEYRQYVVVEERKEQLKEYDAMELDGIAHKEILED